MKSLRAADGRPFLYFVLAADIGYHRVNYPELMDSPRV
jgi:hypothetical protein